MCFFHFRRCPVNFFHSENSKWFVRCLRDPDKTPLPVVSQRIIRSSFRRAEKQWVKRKTLMQKIRVRLLFGCFACFFSSFVIYYFRWLAGVAELADATDSKSVELTPHAGSIPATGTKEGGCLKTRATSI